MFAKVKSLFFGGEEPQKVSETFKVSETPKKEVSLVDVQNARASIDSKHQFKDFEVERSEAPCGSVTLEYYAPDVKHDYSYVAASITFDPKENRVVTYHNYSMNEDSERELLLRAVGETKDNKLHFPSFVVQSCGDCKEVFDSFYNAGKAWRLDRNAHDDRDASREYILVTD